MVSVIRFFFSNRKSTRMMTSSKKRKTWVDPNNLFALKNIFHKYLFIFTAENYRFSVSASVLSKLGIFFSRPSYLSTSTKSILNNSCCCGCCCCCRWWCCCCCCCWGHGWCCCICCRGCCCWGQTADVFLSSGLIGVLGIDNQGANSDDRSEKKSPLELSFLLT